jgi:hypothetical protein
MEQNNNTQATHFDAHNNNQDSNYTKVIDKIFNCVNDHLLMLMNQMLNSADKKLIEKADATDCETERAKFTNCTQVFKNKSNDIGQLFFMNLNNSLSSTSDDMTEVDTLVFQDEMDEMVAITTMHSKAMNTYGIEVSHLEARLEYLEIVCEEIFDKEALDPKHICEIFQRTIENIDLAIEAKLIFYKLFDQEVCSRMGIMYKAINQIFIDHNILPEIMMKTTKQSEVAYAEEEVASRVATYYDPEEKIQTDFVPRTKAEISRIVNDFMAGDMTISGEEIDLPESFLRKPTQQDLDGKGCYDRPEVVKALSNLQHKLISMKGRAKTLSTKDIKKELLDDINQDKNLVDTKKVNLLDERSIDFVGMMFDAIADDGTVSDIVTRMIKRLQIPMMKVAMSDNSLFGNEDHPARVVVNLLTKAGKGINSSRDRLFNNLENIIDNILNDYDTDIIVFDTAVSTLETIINTNEQLAFKTEKLQQKKVLQDHAKNIVTTQYKIVVLNKEIPDNVRPLFLKNWSTLMLNRYLKHGRDSTQWSESLQLLKLLLKCVQPIQFDSQYTLVKSNHISLTTSLNDELYKTKQDKKNISTQITLLKKHFTAMIDDYGYEIVDKKVEKSTDDTFHDDEDNEAELLEIKQQIESAEYKIAKLASDTKPGAWYEIYTGEDKVLRRLKLSIILNDAAKLIFVDRKGVKVIEKDAEEFAKELENNRSRIIADHSTFDHALSKVIGTIAA